MLNYKKKTIYFCLVTLVLTFQFSCNSVDKEEYHHFLSALTYPQHDWKPDDFGRSVNVEEKELLQKYAPNFWIANEACNPMDFYGQYVPLLELDHDGPQKIRGSRKNLKKFERTFSAKWDLTESPDCLQSDNPPLYSYSWQEEMILPEIENPIPIRVLKYAFTFYKSGLPERQSFIQKGSCLLGDRDTWHYLDIHGAVFYLLNSEDHLFAVVLAQHNHFRSFVVGVDVTFEEAQNICFASRSNEPYFCGNEKTDQIFPTAPTFLDIEWIVAGENRPLMGAWDVVVKKQDRKKINHQLNFLDSRDPLITSWISLGPQIKIWGIFSSFYRDSPPGMAIFNHPKLKRIGKTAQYYYFDPENTEIFDLHEEGSKDFFEVDVEPVLKTNGSRFKRSLQRGGWF